MFSLFNTSIHVDSSYSKCMLFDFILSPADTLAVLQTNAQRSIDETGILYGSTVYHVTVYLHGLICMCQFAHGVFLQRPLPMLTHIYCFGVSVDGIKLDIERYTFLSQLL